MKHLLLSLWRRFLSDLNLQRAPHRFYDHDEELLQAVRAMALREQRSEDEVAADLLSMALVQRDTYEEKLRYWRTLSWREQQIAALACLNYTNRQIAARLSISPSTVASHMRNVLYKFQLHSKLELRQFLSDWDFREWESVR